MRPDTIVALSTPLGRSSISVIRLSGVLSLVLAKKLSKSKTTFIDRQARFLPIYLENSEIIEPCFIGENVLIKNSKIGPYVSIGEKTIVEKSSISKTIIQNESSIINAKINNSMIGNKCYYDGKNINQQISIGDFSEIK